ncbi:hypothetical protein [Leptospira bandrabouensis]|uniref:hypothetical protein n=1 Tax=Leptospira bandrabouensis TaxID=2484903 RepID=UPI001EE8241C|nr:hypothetical protein [Leptospira bandrabouensis]MCG6162061.1 hypothetical protein [Leptospira bandrabouensis]
MYVLRNQGIILFLNRIIRKFINRSEHFSESFFSWHLANLHADIVADKLGVKNRLEYIHEILEKERFEVLKYSEIANEFFMLLQKVEKAEIIEVGNSDKSLKDFIAPDSETSRDIKNWLTIPLADFYEQDWLNFKNGIYKYCSESAKDNKEVKTLRILVIHDSIFYTAEPFLIFEAFSKCDFSHIFFMGFYESQMKENVLTVRQNFNTNLIAPIWALKSLEVFQDIMKLTKRKYELRFQGTLGQFNGSAEVVRNSYWFQSQ